MTDPSPRNGLSALLHHGLTLALMIGFLALAVWGYLGYKQNSLRILSPQQIAQSPLLSIQIQTQIDRIKLAASAYKSVHDTAPLGLDELVNQGYLDDMDLSFPRGTQYTLRNTDGRVVVEAQSQDGP